MNSAMQCIAHSPYIRDFFTGISNNPEIIAAASANDREVGDKKHPPYKYQVNPNNPMGQNGDFVVPFAETMGKMWDSGSYFSVYPWGFKSSLGKVNE